MKPFLELFVPAIIMAFCAGWIAGEAEGSWRDGNRPRSIAIWAGAVFIFSYSVFLLGAFNGWWK